MISADINPECEAVKGEWSAKPNGVQKRMLFKMACILVPVSLICFAFLGFLAFLLFEEFLAFLTVVPFFSKDLGVRKRWKILVFLVVFFAFPEKARKRRSGFLKTDMLVPVCFGTRAGASKSGKGSVSVSSARGDLSLKTLNSLIKEIKAGLLN